MDEEKIGTVNHAIQSTIPEMVRAADGNPHAQLLVRTLKFSTGASWVTTDPVKIEDFAWDDLSVEKDGVTNIGKAFNLLAAQLTIPPMPERALPPVLVLLSDGQPTDKYKPELDKLLSLPWGKKSVRIAIGIGKDADFEMLSDFSSLVLEAKSVPDLIALIRWASTVASVVAMPGARQGSDGSDDSGSAFLTRDNIPKLDDTRGGEVW